MPVAFSRLSIRTQVLLLVLTVIVPVAGMFSFFRLDNARHARDDGRREVDILTTGAAANLNQFLDRAETTMARIAARPQIQAPDALTREKLQQELLEIWERTRVTVIFVTHSVEEVVVLSDRVVVLTAGPGCIEHDAAIALARPREVSAIDFNAVRRDITQRLTSHVGNHAGSQSGKTAVPA